VKLVQDNVECTVRHLPSPRFGQHFPFQRAISTLRLVSGHGPNPPSKGLVRLISALFWWHHPSFPLQSPFEKDMVLSCLCPLWAVQILYCIGLVHSQHDQSSQNSGEGWRNQQHPLLPLDATFTKHFLFHEESNSEASLFGYRQYLKSTLFSAVISQLLGSCFFKVLPSQHTLLA
jgi:hypothetical protein